MLTFLGTWHCEKRILNNSFICIQIKQGSISYSYQISSTLFYRLRLATLYSRMKVLNISYNNCFESKYDIGIPLHRIFKFFYLSWHFWVNATRNYLNMYLFKVCNLCRWNSLNIVSNMAYGLGWLNKAIPWRKSPLKTIQIRFDSLPIFPLSISQTDSALF